MSIAELVGYAAAVAMVGFVVVIAAWVVFFPIVLAIRCLVGSRR